MAILRSLLVTVGMKDDDFRKGMSRVQAQADSFSKKLGSALGAVAAQGARFASATTAAFAAITKQSFSNIDAVGKLSDRLGISTEDLAGLQHAADLSGVSMEALTGGLEKFIKQLPKGANVGGEFQAIADQIRRTVDPVERAHIAMQAFGKSGQDLLPLLTSDLRELKREAEGMGLLFSREQAASVEAANDAVERLRKVAVASGNDLAIALAPSIEHAADTWRHWNKELKNSELARTFSGNDSNADKFRARLQAIRSGSMDAALGIDVLNKKMAETNAINARLSTGEDTWYDKLKKGLEAAAAAAQKLTENFKLRDAAKSMADSIIESAKTPLENLQEQQKKLIDDYRAGLLDKTLYEQAYEVIRQQIDQTKHDNLMAETAEWLEGLDNPDLPEVEEPVKEKIKSAFGQVDLSRTAMGGIDFATKNADKMFKLSQEQLLVQKQMRDALLNPQPPKAS